MQDTERAMVGEAESVRNRTAASHTAVGINAVGFEVRVPAEHRYAVEVEPGLLARYGERMAARFGQRTVCVLSDEHVWELYGARLRTSLQPLLLPGTSLATLIVPPGEGAKSMETFARLLERMAELQVDRRSLLVTFGGGVTHDLGGFLASAYMRGIDYANFSTSLLGQVDASLGGKVAVNARVAKNLIGAFHHPVHVASDPGLLHSLSERDYRCGLAETIKVAVIAGPKLFETLEREERALRARDPEVLTRVIGEAGRLKMELIALDPYEEDLRRPLNFGHTIGHPIETAFDYERVRHGEAVAIGMGVATCIALSKGLIGADYAERLHSMLDRYGLLDFELEIDARSVAEHVRYVRLIRGRSLHFVLPRAELGQCEITEHVDEDDLVRGFADWRARAAQAALHPSGDEHCAGDEEVA